LFAAWIAVVTCSAQIFTVVQAGVGPSAPVPLGSTPPAGETAVENFTFTWRLASGAQNFGVVNVLINGALDGFRACYLAYSHPSQTLFLVTDSGFGLLPMGVNGTGSVQNSQCILSAATVNTVGTDLSLRVRIQFLAGFAGHKIFYFAGADSAGANSGWYTLGVWKVPPGPSTPVKVVSAVPQSAQGGSHLLSLRVASSLGYSNLNIINVLVNEYLDGRNACYLAYSVPSRRLWLVDDAGTALLPSLDVGQGGSISNSQCSVDGASLTVAGSGEDLILTVRLEFAPSFQGNRIVYAAAGDFQNRNSGWTPTAWWRVGSAP
jgi:hypothetical protein